MIKDFIQKFREGKANSNETKKVKEVLEFIFNCILEGDGCKKTFVNSMIYIYISILEVNLNDWDEFKSFIKFA